MYPGFVDFFCNCYSFHKSYICKHVIKCSNKFNLRVKGYEPVKVFNVKKARGKKKATNQFLAHSDDE